MAYRYGDRHQRTLFPQTVDEYVPLDAPVRAYDAFVESLDFADLGIGFDSGKVGAPQYDPRAMLKLLVYGYSYGVRSSRKLERHLKKIDKRIKEILSECDAVDRAEEGQASLVKMEEELRDQDELKSKVKNILAELEAEDKKSTNTTDPDAMAMRSVQGKHAAFNVQSTVDEQNGLIVNTDVVNENNDIHQFAKQIDQANEVLGEKCETACADAGYSCVDELEKIDDQDINVVVPSQKQALKDKTEKPFDKSKFKYDSENDSYVCPQGKVLKFSHVSNEKQTKVYRGGSVCKGCPDFGQCTKSDRGRGISRLLKADLQEKFEAQYAQSKSQKIYTLRKQKVELPFGHIKRNLKVDSFLLRGLDSVKSETSIMASCFNIARMIGILGVAGLIAKLGS